MTKKSFVKGAAILAAAGLISKFIGALFRIPLANILGAEGVGIYGMAYPIYAFLLIISTAGIPTAISKIVAEKLALGQPREAHRVFQISFKLMLGVGVVTFVLLLAGSRWAALRSGNERAIYAIWAITPSLIFVSLISAFRGYFQGMQIMTPTAVSQILEQAGKLILGLWFAVLALNRGMGVELAAAAAVVGVTISELAALILLIGIYLRRRREIFHRMAEAHPIRTEEAGALLLQRLARIAVPITVGASIMSIISLTDLVIVANRLQEIGFTEGEATALYGLLTQSAAPLINFPAVLTIALAMSLVPAISESNAAGRQREIAARSGTGIRLTLIFSLPAAAGMAILARPIISLLYFNFPAEDIELPAQLLIVLSSGVVFLTLVQTLTAILQGINRILVPVKNLIIGALFKIVLTYVLVGRPDLHIQGAAIGTIVCFGVAALLNFAAVCRYTGLRISLKTYFIKPIFATLVMCAAVYGIRLLSLRLTDSENQATLLAILGGGVVYGGMLLATGALNTADLQLLPGGVKLSRILCRLRLVREP